MVESHKNGDGVCCWHHQENASADGYLLTDCGLNWDYRNEGTPDWHGYDYCPYCGGKIVHPLFKLEIWQCPYCCRDGEPFRAGEERYYCKVCEVSWDQEEVKR